MMKNWEQVRPVVEHVLGEQRYSSSGDHKDKFCFLTCYQIAVLVHSQDGALKEEDLPIGGKGEGGDDNRGFAQQIAWHLSRDINQRAYNDSIEMAFFSQVGLDKFTFDVDKQPSANEFSMFRIK